MQKKREFDSKKFAKNCIRKLLIENLGKYVQCTYVQVFPNFYFSRQKFSAWKCFERTFLQLFQRLWKKSSNLFISNINTFERFENETLIFKTCFIIRLASISESGKSIKKKSGSLIFTNKYISYIKA